MTSALRSEEGGRRAWAREMERRAPHLNFRWTMADMWKIEEMARAGKSADHIAFEVDATSNEIKEVCKRNGIYLWRA